jgi:hypothetical protein
MQPSLVFLEQQFEQARVLYGSQADMVYKFWSQYRTRSNYIVVADAAGANTPDFKESEERLGHYDDNQRLVSNFICKASCQLTLYSAPLISIIRLYTLNDVARSTDISFDNPAHATLSVLEVNTGIVCACLPAMRPLLALMMPKYFSAATQYTHAPGWSDIERHPGLKYVQTPSSTSQINNTYAATCGTETMMPDTLQAPKSTLSRTPSGRFVIKHTPGRRAYISHSRSGSNISIDIAAADARLHRPHFPVQRTALHLSPIIPYSPLNPRTLFPASGPGTSCLPSRDNSGASSPVVWRAQMGFDQKSLPLTPLPVGAGG